MDIKTIKVLEKASAKTLPNFAKFSLSLLFIVIVFLWSYTSYGNLPNNTFLVIGTVFSAYMAMNIGANDVANNIGPTVGSKALTLAGAIIIAAIFESLGAFIAGEEVVKTIKSEIINPNLIANSETFVWIMSAALLSSALWLNFATSLGAPVSTTHSIVGGVTGAGIAAAGFSVVSWDMIAKITIFWVISPILGGIVAAILLYYIKKQILYKEDMIKSSKKVIPILISFMTWTFCTYIILKLNQLIELNFIIASIIGLIISIGVFLVIKPLIINSSNKLSNNRTSINNLFNIPLIFAATLLSFAHGANDVANSIGPLAAINDSIINIETSNTVTVPFWVMAVGAVGIVLGLCLYGPKLIKAVGSEITELDQIRAYSIAMSATFIVILASQVGLPVSSTHIVIGGVFGVGLLREFLDNGKTKFLQKIRKKFKRDKRELVLIQEKFNKLELFENKSKTHYIKIVELYKRIEDKENLLKQEIKNLKDIRKIKYVKRDAIKKIIAAWIITVPATGIISATIFFMIKGIIL